ncbi:MAG: hypothetical protein JSS41_06455 [Proteobacteria bacterium]|nr:hypothetical protein [Pseudomonadota bacterium]
MQAHLARIAAATALAAALVACSPKPAPIDPQHIATKINAGLPKPYVDGLVVQHAHADGKRMVIDIRIPFAAAAQIDAAKLPRMREQEQGDLNIAACTDADLKALMDAHYGVSRRFLDKDGKTVFEIAALKAPNCKLVGGATP